MYDLVLNTVVKHTLCMLLRENRDKTAFCKLLENKILLKIIKKFNSNQNKLIIFSMSTNLIFEYTLKLKSLCYNKRIRTKRGGNKGVHIPCVLWLYARWY